MTEYTSLRVPEDAKAKAADSKQDGETWADFIQRCADEGPRQVEVVARDDIDQRLARIERMIEELQHKRH
jgi:hypothetical protein